MDKEKLIDYALQKAWWFMQYQTTENYFYMKGYLQCLRDLGIKVVYDGSNPLCLSITIDGRKFLVGDTENAQSDN